MLCYDRSDYIYFTILFLERQSKGKMFILLNILASAYIKVSSLNKRFTRNRTDKLFYLLTP